MSYQIIDSISPRKIARITGGLYLGFIVASVLADLLGHIGVGDAEAVYQTIITDLMSFRVGLVFSFISAFLFLLSSWGLYILLKKVNGNLALLFLLLNAVGVAIQCASQIALVSAMLMGEASAGLQAFSTEQLEGMMLLSIQIDKTGFSTAQLFFGTWLFPLGYLVYKSAFLPRFLGVLLLLDGVAILLWFFQALLFPAYVAIIYPGLALSFIAEFGLGLWLLIKGVKES